MMFTDGRRVICAASKCGSTSLKQAEKPWGWDRINGMHKKDRDRVAEAEIVYCVLRHPMERILSSWRMYFVKPVLHYRKDGTWGPIHWHLNTDIAMQYCTENREAVLEDPVATFHDFMLNDVHRFLDREDPHFQPQWHTYRGLALHPGCHFVKNFDRLQYDLGFIPRRVHIGIWPWSDLTTDDFCTNAPTVEYLHKDWELWNRKL